MFSRRERRGRRGFSGVGKVFSRVGHKEHREDEVGLFLVVFNLAV